MREMAEWLRGMQAIVNDSGALARRGRHVRASVLIDTGDTQHLLGIHAGRIERLEHGPFVMPTWDFALRAPLSEWLAFWQPLPAPGHHDLFAMIRRRALRVEGNLQPFMANLLWFKDVLAAPRGAQTASGS
jgi:hypothetical protein